MSVATLFVDVIVPLGVPNKYTYRVPTQLNEEVEVGKRVLVQFGRTKIYTGVIYKVHEQAPTQYQAKYIESIIDDHPVVIEKQLYFWDWIAHYYCANPGDVLNAALPAGLKLSSTSHVQINSEFSFDEIDHDYFTDREHQVIELLHANPNICVEEIGEHLKVKSVHVLINKLIKKNAVEIYEEVKDRYKPKIVPFIRLNAAYQDEKKLGDTIDQLEKRAFKQAEALIAVLQFKLSNALGEEGWLRKSEVSKRADAAAINALVKKQILEEQEVEVDRIQFGKGKNERKNLSIAQQKAYHEIEEAFAEKKITLMKGVTGSGKTEIYIKLIQKAIENGKQVLYLVPEIALTTQLITRLRAVFGEQVGVYHSRFSENERVEIWNNVLTSHAISTSQHYKIILAARSGLFLPFKDLGLIIIDEEHDFSFKQNSPAPRYHARDAAIYLASTTNANVLLGSATPTLESYQHAKTGKYALVELKDPFTYTGKVPIEICHIREHEDKRSMKGILTPMLFEAVSNALKNKQQVILFQNRRGFAPYTQCYVCAHVPYCQNCDVPLIYHKYQDKLLCHYCGYNSGVPKTCPACGSNDLRFKGAGTEKIEEEIELLFPDAKVVRMDLDTTRSKHAHKQMIDDFESGHTNILIGTQMVTKGLDFENVSVVGIINVDSILNFPDFRSFERAYHLITQLKGRAGRKNHPGKLFIQTNQPQHPVLLKLLSGDQEEFYQEQLAEREQFSYPPFFRLIEINILSKDPDELTELSNKFAAALKQHLHNRILGPEFPLISKVRNMYTKRILIKLDKQVSGKWIRELLAYSITQLHSDHQKWKFIVQVNVDPF